MGSPATTILKASAPERSSERTHATPMLHLIKMAVGIDSVDHLRSVQTERWGASCHRHYTRHKPRREAEIVGKGSLYWVIRGLIRVRQPIQEFETGSDPEGRARCAILMAPHHKLVFPRTMRPFQGWRYLAPADAPADLSLAASDEEPPAEMLASLRELGLL